MTPLVLAVILVVIALSFDFFNGMNDSANVVATMISSHALRPRTAMILTATCEFIGPFLFGVSVATTIGTKVVDPATITIAVTLAALASAVIWNIACIILGIPSSASHALVGGIVGAAAYGYGFDVIKPNGLTSIAIALFTSPILGLVVGYLVMRLLLFLLRGASPRANTWMRRMQWITAAGLALSHGANDAQKTMGVITMGLVATGLLPTFKVPLWVVASAAGAIALGTYVGGWSVIKTLGGKFYKIRPMHALASQVTSASIILSAALLGGPVSTTQVVSASIMGVGSGQRVSQVRWGVAKDILIAWLLTIPVTAILAALLYAPISLLVKQ
jgi:inorganic phosphate transporter, PiT family